MPLALSQEEAKRFVESISPFFGKGIDPRDDSGLWLRRRGFESYRAFQIGGE